MKKIGIDARLPGKTGVGIYTRNLLHFLEKIVPESWQVYVYLAKKDFNSIKFSNRNFIKRKADFRWHTLTEQIAFFKTLRKDNLDLMHFTYFSYPILYKKKFISTIHDLTPLLFKTGKASTNNWLIYGLKYLALKLVLKSQMKNSRAIITPTKFIKQELIKIYGNSYKNKIYAIHEGISEDVKIVKQNKKLRNKFDSFFICVNNFYPHKNTERLIRVFAKVKTNNQLILVGPDDFFTKRTEELIKELKQSKRIILYKNATTEDLVFFYKNAIALINPSVVEGFGLSLVEAAYFGCPIIASDIPVFNEVLGEAFVKFNPHDENDIVKKISYFLRRKPKFDLRKVATKYSFERMAKETLTIYNKYL